MTMMSAQEAFAAYEDVRHRLPPSTWPQRTYQEIATLDDIAADFDVFLLDAFGVLNIGETAIPGVAERIEQFRAAGKHVLVVSNAASVQRSELCAKYGRLGFDFPEADIITSRTTMAAFMDDTKASRWGAMQGTDARMDDFPGLKLAPLENDLSVYRESDGFLLIGSATWTEERQSMLEYELQAFPRRVLVANPDIVAPRENGFSKEPGYFAHRLADKTGIKPEFFGKPFGNIYDLTFARLGPVDKSRVLMVGDSLHTDILGALNAGVASALVSGFGFFAGEDIATAVRVSGIVPDFVAVRP